MKFINRQADISFLKQDFSTYSGRSRFLILSGISGIGKSELINQAFADYENFVRVKIAKHEGVKNIPALYIRELARSLNHLSIKTQTVSSFANHFKEKERSFKIIFKKILADVATGNKIVTSKELGSVIKSTGSDADIIDKLFVSDHSEAFNASCTYIKELLAQQRFIITLENIQNIDQESLTLFRELVILNSELYIIGEYTVGDYFQIEIFDLLNYFAGPYTKTDIFELKKIPLPEIIKECGDQPEVISIILRDSYDNSSGNLHQLQILASHNFSDHFLKKDSIPQLKYDGIILAELEKLDSEHSFFLSAIVAHGGSVDFEIFRLFLHQEEGIGSIVLGLRSIEDFINHLTDRKILTVRKNEIQTAQDSIIENVISNRTFEKYLLISYKKWCSFYQNLRLSSDDLYVPKSESISWEILFKALLNDLTGINRLLDEIYKLTLLSSAPKRAIRYLEKIKETIVKNSVDKKNTVFYRSIDFKIIQILYRLWYFSDIPLFAKDNLEDERIFLFYTSSLALIGRSEEAIELCENRTVNRTIVESIPLQIIKIAAFRASNRYKECEEAWLSLYKSRAYKNTPYEGMFLRCADFARMSDHVEQMECLTNSVLFFSEKSDTLNEISARIALAQHYGYDGNLDYAEAELNVVLAKSQSLFAEHYVLINNLCVLEQQKQRSSKDILLQLQRAASVCSTILDRFIIWNNLFIAQAMLKEITDAESTLKVLEQKIFKKEVADYDLQRIVLYNASVFYSSFNSDLSDYYLEKAKDLPILSDQDFWNYKLNGILREGYEDFRFDMSYYPIYLTYWHFDFDTLPGNSLLTDQ